MRTDGYSSQPRSRHEDEEDDEGDADEDGAEEDHEGALVHELPNVGLADPAPVHEGVFAESRQGEDRVDAILLRAEGVDADCEGKDQLWKKNKRRRLVIY